MESYLVCIDPRRIKEVISSDKEAWTYIHKGGLIIFMECIKGYDEIVSS